MRLALEPRVKIIILFARCVHASFSRCAFQSSTSLILILNKNVNTMCKYLNITVTWQLLLLSHYRAPLHRHSLPTVFHSFKTFSTQRMLRNVLRFKCHVRHQTIDFNKFDIFIPTVTWWVFIRVFFRCFCFVSLFKSKHIVKLIWQNEFWLTQKKTQYSETISASIDIRHFFFMELIQWAVDYSRRSSYFSILSACSSRIHKGPIKFSGKYI